MAGKLNTGTVAVRALRPVRAKGGVWTIQDGRVAARTAQEAESFAADLVASLVAHRAIEDARPAPDGSAPYIQHPASPWAGSVDYRITDKLRRASVPLCSRGGTGNTGGYIPTRESQSGWRVQDAEHGDITYVMSYVDDVETVDYTAPAIVARSPEPAPQKNTRKPRMVKPAPAPERLATTGGQLDPCPRCGRADFRTAIGRAWHLDNNPACHKYRKAEKHHYIAA